MSDLLNSASLVMIPSGYKEDTVYSVVPSDGSGDLSFTRASNGSRVNSAGLVEVCPWNLVLYSEDLANGVWTTTSTTITADNTTAPNGTATADKVEISSSSNARVQQIINSNLITGGLPCTFSVYIKSVSGTGNVGIRSGQTGLSSVFSYTNQWQRFEWTFNAYALSEIIQFCNNTLVGGADSAPSFFAWGAQLNIGSTAKPYFPTTDRLDVPRLTYQNGGGGCPSLLLEKQSTNLVSYSEQLDQWSTARVTITANNTTSPDGTQNAEKLECNLTTTGGAYIGRGTGTQATGYYTISTFAKKGNNGFVAILLYDVGGSEYGGALANLNNSTIALISGGNYPNQSCTIENVGNDWFCISYTCNKTNGSYLLNAELYAAASSGNYLSVAAGQFNYLWGAQVEASSYKTSYIPTTSSSATRVADGPVNLSTTQTLTNFTLFWDGLIFENGNNMIFGSGNSAWYIDLDGSTGRIVLDLSTGRIYGAFSGFTSNQRFKLAIKRSAGVVDAFINGAKLTPFSQVTNTTSLTLSSINWAFNSTYFPKMKVNEICAFQSALTDAECQSLTTL